MEDSCEALEHYFLMGFDFMNLWAFMVRYWPSFIYILDLIIDTK